MPAATAVRVVVFVVVAYDHPVVAAFEVLQRGVVERLRPSIDCYAICDYAEQRKRVCGARTCFRKMSGLGNSMMKGQIRLRRQECGESTDQWSTTAVAKLSTGRWATNMRTR